VSDAGARTGLDEAAAALLAQRDPGMSEALRRLRPYGSAWLALADPDVHSCTSVAGAALDDRTLRYLNGPRTARDIEMTAADRERPPMRPSDLPCPVDELPTWAERLMPAGYHEVLFVAVCAGGRHLGFLALVPGRREPPPRESRRRLGRLTAVLAQGLDPMRSLLPAARLVPGATAGTVLRTDGGSSPLPGLDGDALLDIGSPAVAVARTAIEAGQIYSSFLWPRGDSAAGEHVRVTAMAGTEDAPDSVTGMVLLSPPGELHGLTPRELEVLGHVIDGCSNGEIARALVVAQRTVAAHIEHILTKLAAPSRTLAAVRAEREGIYVPPRPPRAPASAGQSGRPSARSARPGSPPARTVRLRSAT
jgi:DNA-binding CsgD family transcriptional regulator